MTRWVSETVGSRTVGEFADAPQPNPVDVAERSGAISSGVGVRVVGDFVDEAPGAEPTVQAVSRFPPRCESIADAATLYDEALKVYEQLVREGNRSDLAGELARAHSNQAIAVRELGEERAAHGLADQTIALYERLVHQEGRHDLAGHLARAYQNKTLAQSR